MKRASSKPQKDIKIIIYKEVICFKLQII